MVNTEIRLTIFFAAKDGEAIYSQQKQDWELTVAHKLHIAKFRLKLKKKKLKKATRPFNFSFFRITVQGIDLDYCDIEWFALETNRDHSVVFEIASKYCISDSFVDYDGYSISSKGFLPTVVDTMVI